MSLDLGWAAQLPEPQPPERVHAGVPVPRPSWKLDMDQTGRRGSSTSPGVVFRFRADLAGRALCGRRSRRRSDKGSDG